MHRYLRKTGRSFPHRLVAFCPVSLRDDGDTDAGTKASAMFVHLGEHEATVVERIKQVVAAMGTAKQEMRSMSKDAAMAYGVALLGVAELTTATHVDRVTPPLANMVISNVPGARQQMYLNGAPLIGTFPVSAIAMSIGLNATLTSYHDRMDFGFVGSGATMYDLPELARNVEEAYEVKAAASKRHGSKTRQAGTRHKGGDREALTMERMGGGDALMLYLDQAEACNHTIKLQIIPRGEGFAISAVEEARAGGRDPRRASGSPH
jgi:hypothetical protein